MLLAVEGGGFFSSSASGYSKGLSLLILGQKNEDTPMRVSPWNHYQLMDQEPETDHQLASSDKNRLPHGCTSFICFNRSSTGSNTSPLKVGPTHQQDIPPASEKDKEHASCIGGGLGAKNVTLKSSLKKVSTSNRVSVEGVHKHGESDEMDSDIIENPEKRKVQWTDACGSELAEIKEFEPSETGGSDDEFENGRERSCSCTIM